MSTDYQVDEKVWRGPRPELGDYERIKMQFGSIVNLEGIDVAMVDYQLSRPLEFLSAPIDPVHVYLDPPPIEYVDYILEKIAAMKGLVLVHCQHGQDRTGLVIAAYRMSKGMSFEDAKAEALKFGYREDINFGLNEVFKQLRDRYK